MIQQKCNTYIFYSRYYFNDNILYRFRKETLIDNSNQENIQNKSNKNILSDYWNSFFYVYSQKVVEKFKEKNYLSS